MKSPFSCFVLLLISAAAAHTLPFIEVTSVETRAIGGTETIEDGPTTDISGSVIQSTASLKRDPFQSLVASARVTYQLVDPGLTIQTQLTTTSNIGGPAEAEIVIRLTSSRPLLVDTETGISQGTKGLSIDGTFLGGTLAAGPHTIRMFVNNSTTNANFAVNFTIIEDPAGGGEPPPPPPPPPPPASLKWRHYENGQWQQTGKWIPERSPKSPDQVSFDLLPASSPLSAPLPFIDVTSTAANAGSVANVDVSRSSVRFLNFSLNVTGAADQPEALTIRNGGILRVDAPASVTHINFNTAGTTIGDGRKQILGRGQALEESRLEIGFLTVWINSATLSVGERMSGELLIQTRVEDGTPSESTGDLFLGVLPNSSGSLVVTGRFATGSLLAASRPRTFGTVTVERGGLLQTAPAQLGSGQRATGLAFVDDAPVEPDDLLGYSSEEERSTWDIDGTLSLAGAPGSSAGASGGGIALVQARNGGLVTALRADVGAGAPSLKPLETRSALLSASGFDLADNEPAEIRISNTLTVGESCFGRADAEGGGRVSAGTIRVRALGRMASSGFARDRDGLTGERSHITTARENEQGETVTGDLTVDGGGIVELERGGDLTTGLLSIGGVTAKKRFARLRHDSVDREFPRGTLTVTRFIIGAGVNFPARFDLLDGIVSIREDSEIQQGSLLAGFGLISTGISPDVSIRNNGRILVPPGAERVLDVRGSFRQSATGELILTVNKDNDASVAPLQVGGSALVLAGKVTLRFSGGRLPRAGEVYALIRAENAVIANLATFKITGARGAFDIVEDDFGIVLVFK